MAQPKCPYCLEEMEWVGALSLWFCRFHRVSISPEEQRKWELKEEDRLFRVQLEKEREEEVRVKKWKAKNRGLVDRLEQVGLGEIRI